MFIFRVGIAVACLALPSFASAQGVKLSVRSRLDSVALDDPTKPPPYLYARDLGYQTWKAQREKSLTSHAYRPILRFAECISRLDKAAAGRILSSPLKSSESASQLNITAAANRGCAVENSLVHPLLIRAALAETLLKQAGEAAGPPPRQTSVGIPSVVDGYPLLRFAQCQVARAPELTRKLLSTEPGDVSEREAAETLFQKTAICGTARLGRLSPTAARLAIVEAEYLRRFAPDR